jgi:hypothetical protein
MQILRKNRFVLLVLLILLLVLGGVLARQFLLSPPPAPVPSATLEEPPPLREALLYFATADGAGLEAELRELEDCLIEEDCLRSTIQALVSGPGGDLVAVFPATAQIQSISVDGATVTVSFSRELVTGHPGGSMTELLTVYALANTLAANFPHLRQVRVLVDGAPVETLKGHVDLREPVAADFDFGRPQINAGPAGPGGE